MVIELLGVAGVLAAVLPVGLVLMAFSFDLSSQALEPLEGDIAAQPMSRSLGTGRDCAEHLTAWWARLLDSPLISSRSSPRIIAVVLFLISLGVLVGGLVQGHIGTITIAAFMYSVGCGLSAWLMYLRLKLRGQGLDDVSWYDMPWLTRRAGSREQRWLAQWRLATRAKLVVSIAFLVVIAALLVEYWPQLANHFNKGPVDNNPPPCTFSC